MKLKFVLINISLVLFAIGIPATIGLGMQVGAVILLCASAVLLSAYIVQVVQSIRAKLFWTLDNLRYSVALLVVAIVFIHGFSVAINLPLLGNVTVFSPIYLLTGICLVILFASGTIILKNKEGKSKSRSIFIVVCLVFAITSILGLLSIAGILSIPGSLTYYSWVFLLFFYLGYAVYAYLFASKKFKRKNSILILLSVLMIVYWLLRFNSPQLLPPGLFKSIIFLGFVPIIIMPISIIYLKKVHLYTIFIIYSTLLNFYFIHTDKNLNYLITVGLNGCVGYEDAADYLINYDPGLSIEKLLREPSSVEINNILKEWQEKDFSPSQVQIEDVTVQPNGDSIKVISHNVIGKKHYGLLRIPKGLDPQEAPVLLGLFGGGTGIDVLKTEDVYRLTNANCRHLLTNYISIMPSFRGNILRGENFCYRSEGYAGDAWLGAAEDAVALLETVKSMYRKAESTPTIAIGLSRGATVALIAGGLTDKLDYIIANSTHSKFLDHLTLQNEIVGGAYGPAFYTPEARPEIIRKRLIASSPYYFVDHLPTFELHQSTEDQKTTVRHAILLKQQLITSGRSGSTYKIHIYNGEGHGYSDDEIVCKSLSRY